MSANGQLHALGSEVGDGGVIYAGELLDALEMAKLHAIEADAFLSLNAISRTDQPKCVQLRVWVENHVFLVLVDSRSSHTFVNSQSLSKLNVNIQHIEPLRVKIANG